jgi:hypothetical protein
MYGQWSLSTAAADRVAQAALRLRSLERQVWDMERSASRRESDLQRMVEEVRDSCCFVQFCSADD